MPSVWPSTAFRINSTLTTDREAGGGVSSIMVRVASRTPMVYCTLPWMATRTVSFGSYPRSAKATTSRKVSAWPAGKTTSPNAW